MSNPSSVLFSILSISVVNVLWKGSQPLQEAVWVYTAAPVFPSCVTSGSYPNLSVLLFLTYNMRAARVIMRVKRRRAKCSQQCLATSLFCTHSRLLWRSILVTESCCLHPYVPTKKQWILEELSICLSLSQELPEGKDGSLTHSCFSEVWNMCLHTVTHGVEAGKPDRRC